MLLPSLKTVGLSLAGGALIGFGLGYAVYHPTTPLATEKPRSEILLPGPGGGRVVEERPAVKLPPPPGLPKADVVRTITVEVKPLVAGVVVAPTPTDGKAVEDGYAAEPIKVRLDLIREQDGHLRAVATSENGEVVGALDVPVETRPIVVATPSPRMTHWAAEVERVIPLDRLLAPSWGGAIHYEHGPYIGGIGANRYEVRASFGVRF